MPPSAVSISRIADLAPGPARVQGRARSARPAPLHAPGSQQPCLCYAVGPEQAAQDFYVEDASGRVLVIMQDYTLELGRSATAAAEVVDADIQAVQQRLAELGAHARHDGNRMATKLKAERRTLRALYTLLCAVRAHRAGNCHVGKSLEAQQRYILERSQHFRNDEHARRLVTLRLLGAEALLREGQDVTVEGEVCREQDPDAPRADYRTRPTRLVLRAQPGARLLVRTQTEPPSDVGPADPIVRSPRDPRTLLWVGAVVFALAVALPYLARACTP